jgi:hypothetical protein
MRDPKNYDDALREIARLRAQLRNALSVINAYSPQEEANRIAIESLEIYGSPRPGHEFDVYQLSVII